MEKRTPHCKLITVKALVEAGKVRTTHAARAGASELGLEFSGMLAVLIALTPADFYKSMSTHVDHTVWQDVYRPSTQVGDVYLKARRQENHRTQHFKPRNPLRTSLAPRQGVRSFLTANVVGENTRGRRKTGRSPPQSSAGAAPSQSLAYLLVHRVRALGREELFILGLPSPLGHGDGADDGHALAAQHRGVDGRQVSLPHRHAHAAGWKKKCIGEIYFRT